MFRKVDRHPGKDACAGALCEQISARTGAMAAGAGASSAVCNVVCNVAQNISIAFDRLFALQCIRKIECDLLLILSINEIGRNILECLKFRLQQQHQRMAIFWPVFFKYSKSIQIANERLVAVGQMCVVALQIRQS